MRRMIFALIAILLTSTQAFAIREADLATDYKGKAVPYFDKQKTQIMMAKDDVAIHYYVFPGEIQARNTLVIVNGLNEFARKYTEFLYDMRNSGYKIFIYDHRGQGESDRLISDHLKGYVRHYEDFVSDLDRFMETVVRPNAVGEIFMLGHSMGGGISTNYLERHPGIVKAYVASSPLLGIQLPDLKLPGGLELPTLQIEGLTWATAKCDTGGSLDYASGGVPDGWKKPYSEDNVNTSSEARFNNALQERLTHPEVALNGETYRWVQQGLRMGIFNRMHVGDQSTPELIFRAGKEKLVVPEFDDLFRDFAPDAQILEFPESKHEPLQEVDAIRDKAMKAMLNFFASHQGQSE